MTYPTKNGLSGVKYPISVPEAKLRYHEIRSSMGRAEGNTSVAKSLDHIINPTGAKQEEFEATSRQTPSDQPYVVMLIINK